MDVQQSPWVAIGCWGFEVRLTSTPQADIDTELAEMAIIRYDRKQAKAMDSADFATVAATAHWTGMSGLAV